MVRLLIGHVALGELCDTGAKEVDDRLALHSLLEDGGYVRLMSDWMVERIQPTFLACFEAAASAGDLRPTTGGAANPYRGSRDELVAELTRFILRGIGLTDAAIETHLAAAMFWQPAAPAAA